MTTFVVALFLPYTVDFHDPPTSKRQPSPTSQPLTAPGQKDSKIGTQEKKASLFSVPTAPKTPAAQNHAEFFSQLQPSAATHFPKPHHPRSLVRSDSHIPEWGGSLFFNQPRSLAAPAPPDTILEYANGQERMVAKTRPPSRSPPSSRGLSKSKNSRDRSKDNRSWSTQWTVEPAVQGNGGLANAIRAAIDAGSLGDVTWVGLIGFPTDSLSDETRDAIHEKLESDLDSLTVFVSDIDLDGHYAHYCKTMLWPVFNYQIPDHPKSKAYEDHSWIFYVNLNQAFADKVIKSYKRGDIIWVHDYHLLLVPAMIRKKLPDAQIGFFLHTAFPSSEVFRCLATRKELLEGMLGANLVAFQTHEYAHHFLQTCSRLLTVEATEDGVQLDHHFVNVASFPIGIDPKGLSIAREDDEVLDWIKVMQERYQDKLLIVARDKLDNIRGVRQKLLAFELFLNKYPEWRDKVVLIQVATSTTENSELAATVSEIVTRIESVHSTLAHQPLVFLMQDIPFSQYLALLSVADVLMVTSLREGMNLTCHEYIFCQDGMQSKEKYGPIILSEFTGSAAVFEGNELSINPWDYQKCAEAIKAALEMDPVEKERRYNNIRNIVMHHTGEAWVIHLIEELAKVHDEHFRRDTMSIPRLSAIKLGEAYKKSSKRLFLLDYEGTLASYGQVTNIVLTSPQRVIEALNDLISDDKNVVYVMSGRTIKELQLIFDRVPEVGLIAENGCFVREYGSSEEWIAFPNEEKTRMWKESVKGILKYYEERVEGSWVEERRCSLIFHYEKASEWEAANRQAGDCANHINDACENQRVRAIPTKDTVCVQPLDWDKSTAAKHIINSMRINAGPPDFLMVAGNDRDDEIIFQWANELGSDKTIPNVTTVSVGNRNTVAMATLTQGTTGLLSALGRLSKLG